MFTVVVDEVDPVPRLSVLVTVSLAAPRLIVLVPDDFADVPIEYVVAVVPPIVMVEAFDPIEDNDDRVATESVITVPLVGNTRDVVPDRVGTVMLTCPPVVLRESVGDDAVVLSIVSDVMAVPPDLSSFPSRKAMILPAIEFASMSISLDTADAVP